jgi:hypothetical protein
MSDLAAYTLSHVFEHLLHGCTLRTWATTISKIEQKGLLVHQTRSFQGFAKSAVDLERFVLPATAKFGDWERFLQYALTAVNLRGIAESLAEEEILKALADRGQFRFAENLAAQLPTPERRAWAQSVIASASSDEIREERAQRVWEELRELPTTNDPEQRSHRLDLLAGVARHLGPNLLGHWQELIGRVATASEARTRLWLEVAGACLKKGGTAHPGFRMALREIPDREARIAGLSALWQSDGPEDPQVARRLSEELGETDGRLLWRLALPALVRQVRKCAKRAVEAWRRELATGPPVPWSLDLIESGRELWSHLDESEAEQLAAILSDPLERAAFRVVRLEHSPVSERMSLAALALAAVRALEESSDRLHWALRMLLAWPGEGAERKGLAASVLRYLEDRRYAAEPEDLARCLDLVAALFPGELTRQVENALWAPASSEKRLLTLADRAGSVDVLTELLNHAEAYAVVAGANEAAAFELRCRVMIRTATRLAVARENPDPLKPVEEALKRLLPEEQDELCATAARALAAADGSRKELANGLVERIRSGLLKLATRLALGPFDGQAEELSPDKLYADAATAEAIDDERLALAALAEPALDAEKLVDQHLSRMHSKERQGRALVDLARHTLAFEQSFYRRGQQDPLAPIQLLRSSLSGTGSDDRLIELTLELIELAAPLPPRRAVAEVHAAFDAIFQLEGLDWPQRIEAIETLLARLGPVIFQSRREDDAWTRPRSRALLGFLTTLTDLPFRARGIAKIRRLQRHWIEIPPMLVAAAERLPPAARGRWMQKLARAWGGIGPADRDLLRLCAAPPDLRREAADLLLRETRPDPVRVQALCYLVSSSAPDRVPDLVGLFPPGPHRDRLCLRLARNGWLPPAETAALLMRMQDSRAKATAAVLRPSLEEGEAPAWLADLAGLVARGGLDPGEPSSWPVLRRLWRTHTGEERTILAQAVADALAQGGRRAGEDALCIWLNAHLAPRIGQDVPDREDRDSRVREAIRRGLLLELPSPIPLSG